MMVGRMILKMIKRITVEPGMLFYYIGIYFLYSALQPLIYQRTCEDYVRSINSNQSCQAMHTWNDTNAVIKISKDASHWIRYTTICYSVPSLIVDILMGSWSDYFGRKLPMILPGIGQALAAIIYVLISEIVSMHTYWFCIASALSGLWGGPTATIAGMFSYITSDSTLETRTTRFSILQSMTYIAGVVSPFVAGAVLKATSYTAVFSISGGFFLLTSIYCALLKDPGQHKKKVENCCELFNPTHFVESIKTVVKKRDNRSQIILLIIAYLIVQIIKAGELDIMYLFLTDNLKFSVSEFSYFFGYKFGMATLAVLIFLPLAKHFKVPDDIICASGLLCKITALTMFGLSKNTTLAAISILFDGFGEWAVTSYEALLSKSVPENEIGKLLGIVSFTGDISLLLGAVIFNSLYPALKPFHAGGTYFVACGGLAVSLGLLALAQFLTRSKKKDDNPEKADPNLPAKTNNAAFSNLGYAD